MMRRTLMAITAFLACAGGIANAQTVNAPQSPSPETAEPNFDGICISALVTSGKIVIGRGQKKIEMILSRDTCVISWSGIWSLEAQSTRASASDVVEAYSCPEFRNRIAKLWSARRHNPHTHRTTMRADPFVITDGQDLFELKSANGRRAAAQWIRETLAVIRPCWNNSRDDHTRYVVDSLYSRLAMKAVSEPVGSP